MASLLPSNWAICSRRSLIAVIDTFIKGARGWLPVAGNKGDCRTFIKEGGRCLYITFARDQLAGYFFDIFSFIVRPRQIDFGISV